MRPVFQEMQRVAFEHPLTRAQSADIDYFRMFGLFSLGLTVNL